jgi:AraC-like DNA-binding protein
MKYYTIAPPADLAAYVRFFWVLESDQPYCHRSMADGCVEMVFHYHGQFNELTQQNAEEPSFMAGLHGPSQQYRRFITQSGFGIFGVYFYPYSLPRLFGLPANELADVMIALDCLPGEDAQHISEEMMCAKDNKERTAIITRFLRSRARKTRNLEVPCLAVIQQMIHSDSFMNVDQLAKASFLSFRQFERKFKQLSGFSPKRYSRILRFQMATRHYGITRKNLTGIAHSCGYYDQSHFIHEFKQFSGYHPRQYFSGIAEGVAWKEAD